MPFGFAETAAVPSAFGSVPDAVHVTADPSATVPVHAVPAAACAPFHLVEQEEASRFSRSSKLMSMASQMPTVELAPVSAGASSGCGYATKSDARLHRTLE